MKKRRNPHDPVAAIRQQFQEVYRGRPTGLRPPTACRSDGTLPLTERSLSPEQRESQAAGLLEPDLRIFRLGECHVMVGRHPRRGYHLSISHPSRYPAWDEVVQARYRLIPDSATMAMLLPPKSQYVNLHPNCFHLHEVDAEVEKQ